MTTEGQPATEAGRALVAHLDSISRTPYSGISFPDADYQVTRIEAEAHAAGLAQGRAGGLDVAAAEEVLHELDIIRRGWQRDQPTLIVHIDTHEALRAALAETPEAGLERETFGRADLRRLYHEGWDAALASFTRPEPFLDRSTPPTEEPGA